ncbi:lysozyme inhibitor LprI family protein [Rheinheimera sp. 1928-s]|uniref:lysozyme inhibitor LprI family protein n=1 Tax=Rheinheimera sp. 1928-s TaxID=3033803 RepID=UPI00263852F1|nr:lysozyme inhibitor LprI family protein [Rheinheimera sp. 1928-s]MDF3126564.1 lysozyme inhibitor LprI family protein [Rheinheimera sp. 1928-s]
MKLLLIITTLLATTQLQAATADNQINCQAKDLGTVDQLICSEPELLKQDQQLAEVYQQALLKAVNEKPPLLKAEQRGWVKGKADCWKEEDKRACAAELYTQRIAELQARYELLPASKKLLLSCENNPANEMSVRYYPTTPATLIADYGDQVSLMYQQENHSYVGRNEKLSEQNGVFTVQWGYEAPLMSCKTK